MDSNVTHLEIHTGKTLKLRAQAAVPTDPTPTAGDIFIDSTAGSEAIGIRNESGWIYLSLQV